MQHSNPIVSWHTCTRLDVRSAFFPPAPLIRREDQYQSANLGGNTPCNVYEFRSQLSHTLDPVEQILETLRQALSMAHWQQRGIGAAHGSRQRRQKRCFRKRRTSRMPSRCARSRCTRTSVGLPERPMIGEIRQLTCAVRGGKNSKLQKGRPSRSALASLSVILISKPSQRD